MIALSILALGGSATWATVSGGKDKPSWPASLASRSVVEMHNGELVSYSAGRPFGSAYGFTDQAPHVTTGPIAVSGDPVVVVDGQADALHGPDQSYGLGPADDVIPSSDDLDVWVISHRPGKGSTVSLVSVNGDREESFSLPGDYAVIADVSTGLLVANGPRPMVWVPSTNQIVYRFPAFYGTLVATGGLYGSDVAWRDDRCSASDQCPLHLTDVSTQVDQIVAPPPGYGGFLPGGAFAPDRAPFFPNTTTVAVFVADPHHPGRTQVDLVTTLPTVGYRLSPDLPRDPNVVPTAVWAPPWSSTAEPETLFVQNGTGPLMVLDLRAHIRTIPVPSSFPFTVL